MVTVRNVRITCTCTCRWWDEKWVSFNFPYLCCICHVLLWTSAQYPHPPPSRVTCSNGPRLCGWRTISGELFWRYEWTPCSYDLTACADCPTSWRIADNPHFPFQLTICTFWLCPLVSSFLPELSNSVFLGAAHNSNSSPATIFVALLWTFSRQSMSLRRLGDHAWIQYSKCGRTYVLYRVKNCLLLITLKFLYIIPSTNLALFAAATHCLEGLRSLEINTPKSFSQF